MGRNSAREDEGPRSKGRALPSPRGEFFAEVIPLSAELRIGGMKPIPPMIEFVIVLALLTLLVASEPEPGESHPLR